MSKDCLKCGKPILPQARADIGYKVCLSCGDAKADQDRQQWCVIQEYGKGNYTFVTPETAVNSLKQTNSKVIRT